jgi:hypothetical protein
MAKPTGSACNLSCDYCFFLKKGLLYPGSDFRPPAKAHVGPTRAEAVAVDSQSEALPASRAWTWNS